MDDPLGMPSPIYPHETGGTGHMVTSRKTNQDFSILCAKDGQQINPLALIDV